MPTSGAVNEPSTLVRATFSYLHSLQQAHNGMGTFFQCTVLAAHFWLIFYPIGSSESSAYEFFTLAPEFTMLVWLVAIACPIYSTCVGVVTVYIRYTTAELQNDELRSSHTYHTSVLIKTAAHLNFVNLLIICPFIIGFLFSRLIVPQSTFTAMTSQTNISMYYWLVPVAVLSLLNSLMDLTLVHGWLFSSSLSASSSATNLAFISGNLFLSLLMNTLTVSKHFDTVTVGQPKYASSFILMLVALKSVLPMLAILTNFTTSVFYHWSGFVLFNTLHAAEILTAVYSLSSLTAQLRTHQSTFAVCLPFVGFFFLKLMLICDPSQQQRTLPDKGITLRDIILTIIQLRNDDHQLTAMNYYGAMQNVISRNVTGGTGVSFSTFLGDAAGSSATNQIQLVDTDPQNHERTQEVSLKSNRVKFVSFLFENIRQSAGELNTQGMLYYLWYMAEMGFNLHYLSIVLAKLKSSNLSFLERFVLFTVESKLSAKILDLYHGRITPGMLANNETSQETRINNNQPKHSGYGTGTRPGNPITSSALPVTSGLDVNLFFSYSALFERLGKQLRAATKTALEFYEEVSLKSYDIGKLHHIARRIDKDKQASEALFKVIEERTDETQCAHIIPFAKMLDSLCGDRARARTLISLCEQRTHNVQKINMHLTKTSKMLANSNAGSAVLGASHEWVFIQSSLDSYSVDKILFVSKNTSLILEIEDSVLLGKTVSELVGPDFKDTHSQLVAGFMKDIPSGYLDVFKSRVVSPQKNVFFDMSVLSKISPDISNGPSTLTILKRNCYHAPMIYVNSKGNIEGGNLAGLDLVTHLGQLQKPLSNLSPQLERYRLSVLLTELVSKDPRTLQYLKEKKLVVKGKKTQTQKVEQKESLRRTQELDLSPERTPENGVSRFNFDPQDLREFNSKETVAFPLREGMERSRGDVTVSRDDESLQQEHDKDSFFVKKEHMLSDLLKPLVSTHLKHKELLKFHRQRFTGSHHFKSISAKLFAKYSRRGSVQSGQLSKGSNKGGDQEQENSEFLKDFKQGQQILADLVAQVSLQDSYVHFGTVIYLTDLSGLSHMTATQTQNIEGALGLQSKESEVGLEGIPSQSNQLMPASVINEQEVISGLDVGDEIYRSAVDTPTFLGVHSASLYPGEVPEQDEMAMTSRNHLEVEDKKIKKVLLARNNTKEKQLDNIVVRVPSKKQTFVLGAKKRKLGLVNPVAYESRKMGGNNQLVSSSKYAEHLAKEHSDSFKKANIDGQSSLSSNRAVVTGTTQDLLTKTLRWYGVLPVILMLIIQLVYGSLSIYVQNQMNGSLNTQISTLIHLRYTVYQMVDADTTRRTQVLAVIHELMHRRGLIDARSRYSFANARTTYDPVQTLIENHHVSDEIWNKLMLYMQTFEPADVQKVFRFSAPLNFSKNYGKIDDPSAATMLSLTLHANHLLIQGLTSSYIEEFSQAAPMTPSPGQIEPLSSPKLAALIALTSDQHLSLNLVRYVTTLLVTDQDEYLRLVSFVNLLVWLHYGATGLTLMAILGVLTYIRSKLRAVYLCFNKIRDFELNMAHDNMSIIRLSVDGMLRMRSYLATKPKYATLLSSFSIEGVTVPRGKKPPQMPHIADLIVVRDTLNGENFSRFEDGSRGKEQKIYRRGKLRMRNWFGMLLLAIVFVVVFVTYGLFEYLVSSSTSEANQFELAVMVINRAYGRLLYTSGLFLVQTYATVLNLTSLGHPSISANQNIKSISDMMENYDLHFGRMVKFLSTTSKETAASLAFDKFQRPPCPHFNLQKYNMTLQDCNALADSAMSVDVMMVYQWIDNYMDKHLAALKQANSSSALAIIKDPKFRMFEFISNFMLFQMFPDFTEAFYQKLFAYHDSKTYWVSTVLLAVMIVAFSIILLMDIYSLRDLLIQIRIALQSLLLIPLESHHYNPHLKSALHLLSQN